MGAEIAHDQQDAQLVVHLVQVCTAFGADGLQLAQLELEAAALHPAVTQAGFHLLHEVFTLGEAGQQVQGERQVAVVVPADLHGLADRFPQERHGEQHGQGVIPFHDFQDRPGGQQTAVILAELVNEQLIGVAGVFAEGPLGLAV